MVGQASFKYCNTRFCSDDGCSLWHVPLFKRLLHVVNQFLPLPTIVSSMLETAVLFLIPRSNHEDPTADGNAPNPSQRFRLLLSRSCWFREIHDNKPIYLISPCPRLNIRLPTNMSNSLVVYPEQKTWLPARNKRGKRYRKSLSIILCLET
jgi:hypothetical protein